MFGAKALLVYSMFGAKVLLAYSMFGAKALLAYENLFTSCCYLFNACKIISK